MQYKTLFGLTLEELLASMDEELPAKAYTKVPGAADLTDIDPGFMKKSLNKFFGLSGVFWGLSYDAADLLTAREDRPRSNGGTRSVYVATLKRATFWFTLFDEEGKPHRFEIPASGGSDNDVEAYAMKGALTNALGNAVSNIGWQESVYLGSRSHSTVGKKSAPAKSAPAKQPASAAKTKAAAVTDQALENGGFKVTIGRRSGQTLDQVFAEGPDGIKAIQFYTTMATGGNTAKEALRNAAINFLKSHPTPESVAA